MPCPNPAPLIVKRAGTSGVDGVAEVGAEINSAIKVSAVVHAARIPEAAETLAPASAPVGEVELCGDIRLKFHLCPVGNDGLFKNNTVNVRVRSTNIVGQCL